MRERLSRLWASRASAPCRDAWDDGSRTPSCLHFSTAQQHARVFCQHTSWATMLSSRAHLCMLHNL